MNIIDLGNWETYRAETEDGLSYARHRNVAGEDWYETIAHHPDRPIGKVVLLDEDGDINIVYDDVAQADPRMGRVVVLPDYVGTPESLFHKRLNLTTQEIESIVPGAVTRGQALMALHKAGLLPSVRAAVAAHPLEEVRIWFDNALRWERENPYVLAIGLELGLTEAQIDDLFFAAALEA